MLLQIVFCDVTVKVEAKGEKEIVAGNATFLRLLLACSM